MVQPPALLPLKYTYSPHGVPAPPGLTRVELMSDRASADCTHVVEPKIWMGMSVTESGPLRHHNTELKKIMK